MADDVQTFMLSLRRWSNQPDDAPAEDLMRDAADMLDRLSSRLETAERALERHGYRRSCNIPACNCGDQWNHGGHAVERLREISDELGTNGKTVLQAVKDLVAQAPIDR